MNREVHVRFCERFRGETPLYLLDYGLITLNALFVSNKIFRVSLKGFMLLQEQLYIKEDSIFTLLSKIMMKSC